MPAATSRLPSTPRFIAGSGIAGLLMLLVATGPTAAAPAPVLAVDDGTPRAGYFQLTWNAAGSLVELEEATSRSFADSRLIYRGADSARLMSGKRDGRWYYRLRRMDGPTPSRWSDTVAVQVTHHSLGRALFFFGTGALTFGATALLVVTGSRR